MSRHARTPGGSGDPDTPGHRARRRGSGVPRLVAVLCGTALAAGTCAVLTGVLPLPPGAPAVLAPTQVPAQVPTAGVAAAAALFPAGPSTRPPATATASVSVSARPRPRPRPSAAHAAVAADRLAPADSRVADAQQQILALVNTRRSEHGCGALTASAPLNQLAENYSTEMGTENFFSHTDPAGRTPWDRAKAMGITNLGGENIAMGQQTPQAVMTAWMNSSGHRANILDCAYHSLGVGVYYAEGGPWWTQDFGF